MALILQIYSIQALAATFSVSCYLPYLERFGWVAQLDPCRKLLGLASICSLHILTTELQFFSVGEASCLNFNSKVYQDDQEILLQRISRKSYCCPCPLSLAKCRIFRQFNVEDSIVRHLSKNEEWKLTCSLRRLECCMQTSSYSESKLSVIWSILLFMSAAPFLLLNCILILGKRWE